MLKTNKTVYKNKDNDKRKGKIGYQERIIEEALAAEEIAEALNPDEQTKEHELLQTYQVRG